MSAVCMRVVTAHVFEGVSRFSKVRFWFYISFFISGLTGCQTETVGLCFHLQLSVSV
jgi:hypothetical protein